MKLPNFNFVAAADVRRAVVDEGDIRGDIGFQNDINGLLARLDNINPPLQALGLVREPAAAPVLRVRPMDVTPPGLQVDRLIKPAPSLASAKATQRVLALAAHRARSTETRRP